jgi:site-specific recombinase XerD
MEPTDFAKFLSEFLSRYLPGEKGVSQNTILSYRDTFVIFIEYMEKVNRITVNKLTTDLISKEIVVNFLDWIQLTRKCGDSTRNSRLAAMHSFFRFMQYRNPENMYEWQRILSIGFKKVKAEAISYLTLDGIKLLLQEPDQSTKRGRRDLALFSFMYDSAARIQEVLDLTPMMLRLEFPSTVKLIGKGNKSRIVPLMKPQIKHLHNYMIENMLLEPSMKMHPLFFNSRRQKLTRSGVNYLLRKYANKARLKEPKVIPESISCHTLRHSKAMHLLQAGVNLIYIRDILGHSSVTVTEIYARADSQQKREALEKAYVEVVSHSSPSWMRDNDLLSWLKNF